MLKNNQIFGLEKNIHLNKECHSEFILESSVFWVEKRLVFLDAAGFKTAIEIDTTDLSAELWKDKLKTLENTKDSSTVENEALNADIKAGKEQITQAIVDINSATALKIDPEFSKQIAREKLKWVFDKADDYAKFSTAFINFITELRVDYGNSNNKDIDDVDWNKNKGEDKNNTEYIEWQKKESFKWAFWLFKEDWKIDTNHVNLGKIVKGLNEQITVTTTALKLNKDWSGLQRLNPNNKEADFQKRLENYIKIANESWENDLNSKELIFAEVDVRLAQNNSEKALNSIDTQLDIAKNSGGIKWFLINILWIENIKWILNWWGLFSDIIWWLLKIKTDWIESGQVWLENILENEEVKERFKDKIWTAKGLDYDEKSFPKLAEIPEWNDLFKKLAGDVTRFDNFIKSYWVPQYPKKWKKEPWKWEIEAKSSMDAQAIASHYSPIKSWLSEMFWSAVDSIDFNNLNFQNIKDKIMSQASSELNWKSWDNEKSAIFWKWNWSSVWPEMRTAIVEWNKVKFVWMKVKVFDKILDEVKKKAWISEDKKDKKESTA